MQRPIVGLRAVLILLALTFPVAAQDAGPQPAAPALGSASLSSMAHAPMPRPSYVEVVLADDSPDNVRLAWETHHALQNRGWHADSGPTLRLTLATYTIGALGAESPPDDEARPNAPAAGEGEQLYVLGVLEGDVVDVASGARLWEVRAVYRMADGDLPLGALALAPLLVEALGKTLSNEQIRLQ